MRLRTTFVILVCLMLGMPCTAQASPRCPQNKAQARRWVQQGKRLLRQRQYRRAVGAFQRAYCFYRSPNNAFNLALAHVLAGDKLAAYRYLRRYQQSLPKRATERLPAPLRRLRQAVGVLRVQAPRADDSIWVDGQRAGTGKIEVPVLPGLRAVEIRRGARIYLRKEIHVHGGQELVWTPTLVARRPPPGVRPPGPKRGPSERRRLHWAFFTATATLALAASIPMTYYGVRTLQLRHDIKVNDRADLYDKAHDFRRNCNIFVGIAATLAAASVLLAIFTRWKRTPTEQPAARQDPAIRWDGQSVTLTW